MPDLRLAVASLPSNICERRNCEVAKSRFVSLLILEGVITPSGNRHQRYKESLMNLVQKWLKPAAMVALSLTFLLAFLLIAGHYMGDVEENVRLPLLTIVGVIVLLGAMTFVAIAFSALELSDKSQALGLPDGSIRAVIAIPPTAPVGKWDVIVTTSDKQTAKLANGFEITVT